MDLQETRTIATEIAQQAGAVLMQFYDQPHHEETKQTFFDIVTEADKASEALIVVALREAFPEHHIQGEEGGDAGASATDAEFFWYIDPLDGTTNFANNIPFFTVSMALTDRKRNPLVGVVYNPVHGELYRAVRGSGVTRNDKPVHVSATPTLNKAMLASGFPYDKATNPDNNLAEWGTFMPRVRGLRRFGSAALELCYVASGRLEGYWEKRLNPWDCLAGILCVEEAGGQTTDFHGKRSEKLYDGKEVLASNGLIQAEMLAILAEVEREKAKMG